jgi:hypothetical protein
MAISDDILIDYTNKIVYGETSFLASSRFYTGQELYSYLQEQISISDQMDDQVIIQFNTPQSFNIVNGWYFQQAVFKHFKTASFATSGYNGQIQLVKFGSTYTNAVTGDIGKDVKQGSLHGTLLDFDNTKKYWWVRSTSTYANSTTTEVTTAGGTGTGTTAASSADITGEEVFAGITTIGTVNNGNAYILQNGTVLTSWWGTGNSGSGSKQIDVCIKIKEAGTLIDSGDIKVFNRNFGDTYTHASATLVATGPTPVAIETSTDANISLTESQAADYVAAGLNGTHANASITVTFGSFTADVDQDGTNENYSVKIDANNQRFDKVIQALQWMTAKDRTSSTTLNSVDGRIYVSGDPSYAENRPDPFGSFAGGKLLLAQGVYIINIPTQDVSNYEAHDTTNVKVVPPSFVTVQVTNLVGTGVKDRVAIFKLNGSNIDKAMFTAAAGNTSGNGTFVIQESVPADTPATGYIRVRDLTALTEQRYAYTSINKATKTFTLSGTLSQTYANTDKAYIGYIDDLSTTTSISVSLQYASDRNVRAVVRNADLITPNAIVPFSIDSTITSTGLSVPATRTPDTVLA